MSGITDLVVWKEAAALSVEIEAAAETLRGPHAAKWADQIVRAADSIQANVAEGYGKGVTKDGVHYFRTAHASADELEGHLRVLEMKKRLEAVLAERLIDHTRRVGFLVYRYQLSLERRMKP